MRHTRILTISKADAETINQYLTVEPKSEDECLGEDTTISYTACFDNGIEMDIKCCGVQYHENESNLAWTEAVLFENGAEVACTEVEDEFIGEWVCEYDNDEYVVIVKVEE